MKRFFVLVLLATVLLFGCSGGPDVTSAQVEEHLIEPTAAPPESTAAPTPTESPIPPPTETPLPSPTPEPEVGTFANPYPFSYRGDLTWEIEYEDFLDGSVNYEMGFADLKWGDECAVMVSNANMFNDPPDEGQEYLCVKVWLKNIGNNPIGSVNNYLFAVVSDGQVFSPASVVGPDPRFDADGLFPGGETEGWAVYPIKVGDLNPMFSFYADPMDANTLIQMVRP